MTWPRVFELPYREDASEYFSVIKEMPWPVWLDSGRPVLSQGRYDILAAAPIDMLQLDVGLAGEVPLRLRELLGQHQDCPDGVPFCGGLIGFMSYELGRAWQGLPESSNERLAPDLCAGLYDWALVVDHYRQSAVLAAAGRSKKTRGQWHGLCELFRQAVSHETHDNFSAGSLIEIHDQQSYRTGFEKIQRYIREGDIYQVNFTRRFEAKVEASAWSLYQKLRTISPAPYGAYLSFPDFQVLSNSPEQFVGLQDGHVQTRPIKGTRPRGTDRQHDARLRADLAASEKDRAENLMIVDLLRNDLGRVCVPGSIDVPELFAIESYATVHHLVSTVRGMLIPGQDAVDLLLACFPGGSITGAPKLRAMQIIDELESVSRELYCGSIFRLGFDGALDSSISIRTLLKCNEDLYYWAGGGIVADSACDAELQESLDKAAVFFKLLD